MKKRVVKYCYVVKIEDLDNKELYLSPIGNISSEFKIGLIDWDYLPTKEEVLNLCANKDIKSIEVIKVSPYMYNIVYKEIIKGDVKND